jgi:chromosome segregation ATPase
MFKELKGLLKTARASAKELTDPAIEALTDMMADAKAKYNQLEKHYNNLQEKNRKLTQVNNDLREQLLEIDKFITEKAPELTRDGNTANSVKAFANYLGAHFTSAMNAYSQEIEGRLKEAESTIRRLDHDNSD